MAKPILVKELEEELAVSEAKYRSLIENAAEGIATVDLKGRFTFVNKALGKILGYSQKELIGKPFADFLHPEDKKWIVPKFLAAWSYPSRRPHLNFRAVHKKGHFIRMYSCPALFKRRGMIAGFHAIINDITDLMEAEQALRESEAKLHAILSNMSDYVLVTDEDYTIRFVNEFAKRTHGDIVGKKCYEAIRKRATPCHHAGMKCEVNEILEKGRDHFDDIRLSDRIGRIAHVQASPIQFEDKRAVVQVTRDVTEERRAKDELEKSLSTLTAILESTADGILVVNQDQKIVAYNKRWVDLLNIPDTILRSRDDRELMKFLSGQIKDFSDFEKKTLELLANPDKENFDVFEFKNGRIFERYSRPHKMGEQTVGRVVSIREITERKMMENDLRRYSGHLEELVAERTAELESSKRFLEATMESAPDPIYIKDVDSKYVFANQAYCTLFGKSKDEITGSNVHYLYPKEMADLFTSHDREVIEQGNVVHVPNVSVKSPDGTTHIIYTIKAPVKDASGRVAYLIGITRDMTALKQTEERLRRSEKFRSSILEHSAYPILVVEPDSTMRYVNPAFERLTGYSSSEIVGMKSPYPWWPEEDIETIGKNLENVMSKERVRYDRRFRRKNGESFWVEVYGISVETEGEKYYLSHWIDITERKRLDEMKDRFISAVTHELRTPLVSVKGYVEHVLKGKQGPVPDKIESSLAVVKRNTDRLINLTNELLDVRRLQAGRLELSLEPVDIREIIDQCSKEIQPLIDSKHQQLQMSAPNKPLHVQADRARIAQAIINLLNNASKFTPEGGRVTLCATENAEEAQVQVSDTGIGIRNEDLGKVFEPFTYIKKSIQAEGTGLGLSITKGLIEAHGGRIWVESAGEGEGATFTFTLPRVPRNEAS